MKKEDTTVILNTLSILHGVIQLTAQVELYRLSGTLITDSFELQVHTQS